ncbi:hypothetical protein HMPREF0765_2402 [Sphingobacterium spiritivorum ATCC 33300]|uniref:Uncharacterized protein n=1 Tax=Sphingobacterium spiritivorum ATCC 33300 TaxID=525372 RepID=C2FYJ6_SPHSI|nr:hypothetical protein [Sphingobacterium spiritivorum]EEI92016.1 hypothetical protein HMPREF0765_2402 [Sphingobacterium spiritivorum ATCC 33300]QQS96512.1 hypothetical protein I6J03_02035 [Sphingobacterium spiritivorum]
MKGINSLKHQQMKQVLVDLEHLLRSEHEMSTAYDIRKSRESLVALHQQYRDTLNLLEVIIKKYEQESYHIRTAYLARPVRRLQRTPHAVVDIRQLVNTINSLAK